MGINKALIEIEGIPIINRIHSLFEKLFQEIIIVTGQRELFQDLNARIYADLIPNRGVLSGLYTGLFFSSYPYSFCVACDMPFLKQSVIEYLIKEMGSFDVIVPRTKDGLQPLHALYSRNCIEPVKKAIALQKCKITDFYSRVRVKVIEESEFCSLDPRMESFINVNTPQELLLIKKEIDLR
jgi:molybdopterin-guanine dinucleotide biosynthesis protein A